MPLTIEQLDLGITYWRGTDWPQDFHNSFYADRLPAIRPSNGIFDVDWWNRFWPVLQEWRANRRGGGRNIMTRRAHSRLAALTECWAHYVVPHLDEDIVNVTWEDVCRFPELVAEIKNVRSPVFTSKFCHFLAPRIFPVVDNAAMGNPFPTYDAYYKHAQSLCVETGDDVQDKLTRRLIEEIGAPLANGYPMACKLIELRLIGSRKLRLHSAEKVPSSSGLPMPSR